MNAIGFARTLGGHIEFCLIALVLIVVVYCLIRFLLFPHLDMPEDEEADAIKMMNTIGGILSAIFIIYFVLGSISMSISNKTPRQDIDRRDIYRQMESH